MTSKALNEYDGSPKMYGCQLEDATAQMVRYIAKKEGLSMRDVMKDAIEMYVMHYEYDQIGDRVEAQREKVAAAKADVEKKADDKKVAAMPKAKAAAAAPKVSAAQAKKNAAVSQKPPIVKPKAKKVTPKA